MPNREKLAAAVRMLKEVAADMDTGTWVCPHCGYQTSSNLPQLKIHESLTLAVGYLSRALSVEPGQLEKGWAWDLPDVKHKIETVLRA